VFEATLGSTDLGLALGPNPNGVDNSACVSVVCKAMERAIKPGFFVVTINGISKYLCQTTAARGALSGLSCVPAL
jgi:hypothetical protein